MAGGRGKEESQVCFQGIIPSSSSSPLQMCHQPGLIDLGSGDLSLHLGSSASYSATSSSSNSRGSADQYDVDPVTDLSPDDLSFLQDGEVRAMFKKTTVNEALLNQAVDRLGGGRKGMKGLIAYIKLWIREKSNSESSMSQCIASLGELQTPALLQASSSSVVPDYNVSPHGHSTTPPVSLEPQVTNGLGAKNSSGLNGLGANNSSGLNGLEANKSSGLKRPLSPFEPPLQHPPQAVQLHRDSKVCRMFGGTLFAEAAIDSGFSLRETVSCAAGGMTTYSPTICNSAMNLINPPNDRLMIHDMIVHQPVASLQTAGSGFERNADDSFNLSPAASKRAARKNRIAQQRQSLAVSRSVSQGSMSSLGCGSWTGLPGAGGISDRHQANSPIQPRAPVRNKGQVWKTDSLLLLLQKDLRPSDVGNLGRIILPKKESEAHLPCLTLKEGVLVSMEDFDTGMTWTFRYRYWPNNRSRMYLLENTGEFVKAHGLEEGDLLIIYRHLQQKFVIRGKKNGCSEAPFVPTGVCLPNDTHSLARVPSEGGTVKVEEIHDERLHLNVPVDDSKMEPFDTFLQDVMQGLHNEQCGEGLQGLQQLERFPSLDPDVAVDDILGLAFAGAGLSTIVPKIEPGS